MYELPSISEESRGPLEIVVQIAPTSWPTHLAFSFTSTLLILVLKCC